MSRYGVFSGPFFPAFGLNTGKCGPDKTPYLDTFHTVNQFGEMGKGLMKFSFPTVE